MEAKYADINLQTEPASQRQKLQEPIMSHRREQGREQEREQSKSYLDFGGEFTKPLNPVGKLVFPTNSAEKNQLYADNSRMSENTQQSFNRQMPAKNSGPVPTFSKSSFVGAQPVYSLPNGRRDTTPQRSNIANDHSYFSSIREEGFEEPLKTMTPMRERPRTITADESFERNNRKIFAERNVTYLNGNNQEGISSFSRFPGNESGNRDKTAPLKERPVYQDPRDRIHSSLQNRMSIFEESFENPNFYRKDQPSHVKPTQPIFSSSNRMQEDSFLNSNTYRVSNNEDFYGLGPKTDRERYQDSFISKPNPKTGSGKDNLKGFPLDKSYNGTYNINDENGDMEEYQRDYNPSKANVYTQSYSNPNDNPSNGINVLGINNLIPNQSYGNKVQLSSSRVNRYPSREKESLEYSFSRAQRGDELEYSDRKANKMSGQLSANKPQFGSKANMKNVQNCYKGSDMMSEEEVIQYGYDEDEAPIDSRNFPSFSRKGYQGGRIFSQPNYYDPRNLGTGLI